MKNIILFMALFGFALGATAQQSDAIKTLTVTAFKKAIKEDKVQLVDVRTLEEFKEGAIENALNIDYFEIEKFKTEFGKLDKDKPIYLYCRSGSRSQKAAARLETMGFKKIFDLKGGYMGWPERKQ
ncbi:rhodanese-like domain-containing protein [Nonlabens antarcticus]|uniref:rhodanese-like domain-containing protein n=1 Tax=Nonlabens antarcticus TaxID=392714 RepID=UPI001E2C2916|nr:rhodanese-like domain-containing protein [Nonlabens antarcticus]